VLRPPTSRRSGLPLLRVATLLGLGAVAPSPAAAQVGVHLGLVVSSNLVGDSIVNRFSVRANPALALGVTGETRLDRYWLGAALTVSRSDVVGREPQGEFTVSRLTIWHPTVYLRQPLRPWLSGEARLGLIIYHPSVRTGTLFRDGTPVQPALGVGLRVEHRLGGAVAVGFAGHYDLHRFSTPRLRAEGFTGHSYVHRVSAVLSLRRIPAHERPAR
jgi:hypothetical protein